MNDPRAAGAIARGCLLASVLVAAAPAGGADAVALWVEAENYAMMSGIDTESCSEGGQNVGWIDAGDWMTYNVNVATSGTYTVEYRVASPSGGGSIQFEAAGGGTIYGTIGVPATGGWQSWTTISHSVVLNAGQQQVAIAVPSGGYNVNWFDIESDETAEEIFNRTKSLLNDS